jgi:hypothetical protein
VAALIALLVLACRWTRNVITLRLPADAHWGNSDGRPLVYLTPHRAGLITTGRETE